MKKIQSSGKVYIGKSKIDKKGRGVFAKVGIKNGETIEICPILEIAENETHLLNKSSLVTYTIYFGKNKNRMALILGYGSLYNHSKNPNAIINIKSKGQTVIFTAIKDISKDEEIYFNYAPKASKNRALWFEV